MTPKQRFLTALERGVPDRVPTFELEFQLAEEMFGKHFLREEELNGLTPKEVEFKLNENAETLIDVYTRLEHDAICVHYLNREHRMETARLIHRLAGDRFALFAHGDGTFAIPDGPGMERMAVAMYEDPESLHEEARRMRDDAIKQDLMLLDAGYDGFILCSDYCFNQGPFMSPRKFREFVFPYLCDIIRAIRSHGGYAIKHTDGNIMPIIDMLVDAEPHALHSLDPMAGVDIAEVKRLYGHRVALCGNVHCAAMQTGTVEEVVASAEYCLTYAKPGGGYVFATSNIPFKGLPPERYQLVLDVWKRMRDY